MRKRDIELTKRAKKLCKKLFGINYNSYAKFETTTTTTVGRFHSILNERWGEWGLIRKRTNHYHIEIQLKFARRHPDLVNKVLGHELCHYYCYVTDRPYDDSDNYFQKQLKRHNLPASIHFIDDPKRYVIYCPKCHNIVIFKSHIKTNYECAFDETPMKRYGFIRLHGCYRINNYKEMKQFKNLIKHIIFKKVSQNKLNQPEVKFNDKKYQQANLNVTVGQQMSLFA